MLTFLMLIVPAVQPAIIGPRFTVTLHDGSTLNDAVLMSSSISIRQPYGVLAVPVEDVKHLSTRIRHTADDDIKAIVAIKQLTDTNESVRKTGHDTLVAMKRKSMPQLMKACNSDNKSLAAEAMAAWRAICAIPGHVNHNQKDCIYTVQQDNVHGEIVEAEMIVYTESMGVQCIPIEQIVSIAPKAR